MDADKANGFANSLNKKQKVFDKMIEKWKRKCGVLLTREIEANKRKTRNGATEIFRFAGSKKQIRLKIEKRVAEKEEFQNTRNNHQRALESMKIPHLRAWPLDRISEEYRRHAETIKNRHNKERKVCKLQFQANENKTSAELIMHDLIEKDASENQNLQMAHPGKYRQMQHMIKDAEERDDIAENSLN
ncbi:Myosin tail family protein [Dirofilaria immitis]|nr:Myosin tail family protein [Dirofilaria immitis]